MAIENNCVRSTITNIIRAAKLPIKIGRRKNKIIS